MTDQSPALDGPRRRPGLPGLARVLIVVAALYGFLVGISMLEEGIAALGQGFEEGLLASVGNPLAGLFAGVLFTIIVQSSSVSTSAIVGLVGSGTVPVSLAVPMVMGANIGTTVTNTLASLGSLRQGEQFRRAFAAATVHDVFNLIAVVVILPLELLTGFLTRAATWGTARLRGTEIDAAPGDSPISVALDAPVDVLVSAGEAIVGGGRGAGVLFLALGLALILLGLALITRHMRHLVADSVERALNRIIGRGGGAVGIVVGLLVTIAVQSSSITTSILVPLAATGIIVLRNVYPITVGANVGTTLTALLASLAVAQPEGLTIALVHLGFNLTALVLLYLVPYLRDVPPWLAEQLADQAARHRSLVAVYVAGVFIVVPAAGMLLLR